jgi:hypothetical protein
VPAVIKWAECRAEDHSEKLHETADEVGIGWGAPVVLGGAATRGGELEWEIAMTGHHAQKCGGVTEHRHRDCCDLPGSHRPAPRPAALAALAAPAAPAAKLAARAPSTSNLSQVAHSVPPITPATASDALGTHTLCASITRRGHGSSCWL